MSFIYAHTEATTIIKAYIRGLPEGHRRGVLNRIAKAASIFPSYLSQILKGDRFLNQDQAVQVAEFMSLNDQGTRYFLRSTDLVKAQSKKLKENILKEMDDIRANNNQIQKLVQHEDLRLNEIDQAKFYSSWLYTAVRLLTAIPQFRNTVAISHRLGISEKDVRSIIEFLLRTGLCVDGPNGISVGPIHTHLEDKSPHISSHHANWRRRAMDRHPLLDSVREVAYSGVLTLNEDDAAEIRNLLLKLVRDVRAISDPSPAREVYALNIDWFLV